MSQPIISVSGLRGIIGHSLTPVTVTSYVAAFASQLDRGPVVVTRDGRASGGMMAAAVEATLTACGCDVLYGDVAATPTTGVLVRELGAAGGVQISASHNPPEYNGIKLFGSDGRVIPAEFGQRVIEAMSQPAAWVAVSQLGRRSLIADPLARHLQLVLDTVDVEAIRRRGFRVVLDSNHGAGSLLGRELLQALGTEFVLLGDQPDGQFAHPPEPTADNLRSVSAAATAHNADVMFCQDPDADRLAIVASDGTCIGEEYTLAITLNNRLAKQPGDCVVNCATSRMAMDIASRYGATCHLSAVGEAHVCDRMNEVGAVYGGEGNGGPIDPRVGMVRDSFVGMAQVLEALAESAQSVHELVNGLPEYAIHKTRSQVQGTCMPAIIEALKQVFADAEVSQLDGLRLDWPRQWLLVRPSNTEPIVRIIAEAETGSAALELTHQAAAVISRL